MKDGWIWGERAGHREKERWRRIKGIERTEEAPEDRKSVDVIRNIAWLAFDD